LRREAEEEAMRAVVCRELGGIEGLALADRPVPQPGPGELRIRVRAAGLNFADLLMIKGQYQEKPPLPFVPGLEVAGQIEDHGPGVAGFTPGQRIMATVASGGFAEEVVAPAGAVVSLPDEVDYVTAASLPIAYGTAYGALVWAGRLRAGETLVVHGAAGGVGLATVEVGRALGASVIATARGAERLKVAATHGAQHGLDSEGADLRAAIKELTQGRGADVIVDPVGGEVTAASIRALAWEGRLLIIGFASGAIPQIPANLLLVKNIAAIGFYWGSYRQHDPVRVQASFETLLRWCLEGRIRPHVSLACPLAEYATALQALADRRTTGKVVLTMPG
jgi:NADPH2:quinone reductase